MALTIPDTSNTFPSVLNYAASAYDASAYSDSEFANKAKILLDNLAKVFSSLHYLNAYERQQANRKTYHYMYGLDEITGNNLTAPRRSADTINASREAALRFYATMYKTGRGFFGATLEYFPNPEPMRYLYDYYVAVSGYIEDQEGYPSTVTPHGTFFEFEYWDCYRLDDGIVNDNTSIFNGTPVKTDLNTALDDLPPFQKAVFRFVEVLGYIGLHISAMIEILSERDTEIPLANRLFSNYWTQIFRLQPHDIVRIRQALTEVRSKYTEYDPYNPGTSTTSTSSGRIGKRIKQALKNRSITFASAEIADKTLDLSAYCYSSSEIDDPLIITAAGFAGVNNKTGGTALVPAVHLCRKYLMRNFSIPYDYAEATNPNTFEKEAGRVNYSLSNSRVFTNSRSTHQNNWKVKTHAYDAFPNNHQYTYLQSISPVLRSNIAKTTIGFNMALKLSEVTTDIFGRGMAVWAFLPTLTMFGIENRLSARTWTNTQVGMDYANYIDTDGTKMYWSFNAEAEYGIDPDDPRYGNYICYEEYEEAKDLIENAWELGTRRLKFQVNPNCKDASTVREKLYIPTSTPAVNTADTRDTTIPNRVACFYLSKADGTATTGSMGTTNPYNVQPATYAFALVPFHTDKTDLADPDHINGPVMTDTATAFEDL